MIIQSMRLLNAYECNENDQPLAANPHMLLPHIPLYIHIYIYHYTLTHSNESGWHVPLEDSFPLQLEVFHVHVSELKRLFEGA